MRASSLAWLASLALAGCFAPSYDNDHLACASGERPCPDGYHCAADDRCWQNGSNPPAPDLLGSAASDGMPPDLAGGADGPPPDLTPDLTPVTQVYPPATAWISSGGGSPVGSSSSAELNVSIGGAVLCGDVKASGGAEVLFSYFTDDTF
jgi:hypothetical protein